MGERPLEFQRLFAEVRGRLLGEPAPALRLGRYLVGERIGAGGMGVVYAGIDPELGRKVAIKLVRPDRVGAGSAGRDRLLREAQAMARISSPHAVTVYEAGTYGDQVFVVMEFVAGATLTQWLGEAPRRWREVVEVFVQAGRGLQAAHQAGLIHRDFKPKYGLPPSLLSPRPRNAADSMISGGSEGEQAVSPCFTALRSVSLDGHRTATDRPARVSPGNKTTAISAHECQGRN